jgi:hypothetical protein
MSGAGEIAQQGKQRLRPGIPLLVVAFLLGYWAPWAGAGTAKESTWIALAGWAAAHGLGSLEATSLYVTAAVTFVAIVGATLSLLATQKPSEVTRKAGVAATCAPLCVLLPLSGTLLFAGAIVAVCAGRWALGRDRPRALWQQAFPVLSAGCFLGLSWQYNARSLLRGELVAAGVALIVTAVLVPGRAE